MVAVRRRALEKRRDLEFRLIESSEGLTSTD